MNVQENYLKFRKIAIEMIQRGEKNYSVKAINEILFYLGNHDKINSYTALMARIFIKEFPQHKDFFKIKKSYFDCVEIEIIKTRNELPLIKLKIPKDTDVILLKKITN